MTLEEFLEYIDSHVRRYGEFRIVATPRPSGKKRRPKQSELMPVTDIYPDDKGEDIILLVHDEQDCSGAEASITLKELNRRLKRLAKGRKQYSVECSSSKPDGKWRLDFPVCGSGVNEAQELFALLL